MISFDFILRLWFFILHYWNFAILGAVVFLVVLLLFRKAYTITANAINTTSESSEDSPQTQQNSPPRKDIESHFICENQDQSLLDSLSVSEKLELSWKFLYEITEIVLQNFNPQDRDSVHDIGKQLHQQGMRYEHVIDLGIKPKHLQSRTAEIKLQKASPKERAI